MATQYIDVIFCGPHQKQVKVITADGTVIGHFVLHGYAGRFEDDKLVLGMRRLFNAYLGRVLADRQ